MASEKIQIGERVEYVGPRGHKIGASARVVSVGDNRIQIVWANTGVGDWVSPAHIKRAAQ